MVEAMSSDTIPSVSSIPEPKVHRIGLYNRLAIIISGSIISLCLMIGWVLWLTVAHDAINYYIDYFNTMLPIDSKLQITFNELSIFVFLVSGLSLILIVVPFIFIRIKNNISAFFSLISFILSAILVIWFTVFVITRFETFQFLFNKKDNESLNTNANLVIVFLPWFLSTVFAVFLLGNSICLTINVTSKYKSNAFWIPIIKPKTKSEPEATIDETTKKDDESITIPAFTQQITPQSPQQPVTITVTNNTTLPQQQNQDNLESQDSSINTNTNESEPSVETSGKYSSYVLKGNLNTGAYASEAVLPTPGTINISEQDEEKATKITSIPSIYSNSNDNNPPHGSQQSKYEDLPTRESDISNEIAATTYRPENQGGFDVQGETIQPEMSNANSNQAPVSKDNQQTIKSPKPEQPSHHWTLDQIQTVWEKAEPIDGVSDKLYRKDYAGAWMFRDSFTTNLDEASNEKTYSWTIVLHRPASQSGTTELYNLDPMNIVNAKSKGENYPRWVTRLSSKGNENVRKEQSWKART